MTSKNYTQHDLSYINIKISIRSYILYLVNCGLRGYRHEPSNTNVFNLVRFLYVKHLCMVTPSNLFYQCGLKCVHNLQVFLLFEACLHVCVNCFLYDYEALVMWNAKGLHLISKIWVKQKLVTYQLFKFSLN